MLLVVNVSNIVLLVNVEYCDFVLFFLGVNYVNVRFVY